MSLTLCSLPGELIWDQQDGCGPAVRLSAAPPGLSGADQLQGERKQEGQEEGEAGVLPLVSPAALRSITTALLLHYCSETTNTTEYYDRNFCNTIKSKEYCYNTVVKQPIQQNGTTETSVILQNQNSTTTILL